MTARIHAIHGSRDPGTPRRASRLPVAMDRDTIDRLSDAALAEGVTPSEWAERAIEERLARLGIAPPDAPGPARAAETPREAAPPPDPTDSRPEDDGFARGLLLRQAGRPTIGGGPDR